MATKIGDLFFDVYADVSKALKNVDDLQGKFVNMGKTAAKAIGETVANAVGIAVGATALLIGSTLSAGAAYNTLGQSATAAFSSIYNDLNAAHSILQDISTLDLETPFSGKALTSTARTLAGFGFQLKDVTVTTEALAQATAAMGLGSDALHRMAIAFGQIQSRGKLAGDEARQLANYGIDAYGLLADKLGLSVAAVRELGQAGKLQADVVIPALVDSIQTRFAGATEKLFNTAAGQAEGLRSVFEAVGSALVEPFIGFSGGGAIVDAMSSIREELVSLVSVAEDGSFQLQGFLAPLEPLVQTIADGVANLADRFAGFLGGLSDTALTDLVDKLSGLGPTIAGVGAALLTVFAQAIPFVGRFVAGFNPIVVGLTTLALTSSTVRASLVDTFDRIWAAVQPLIPGIKEFVQNLQDIAEQAIPIILDALANSFEDLSPSVKTALDAVNSLLDSLGPAAIEILQALADVLHALTSIISMLPPELVVLVAGLYAVDVLLPTLTTGLVANTAAVAGSSTAAALAATSWGIFGTAILAAAAAVGAYQAVSAGVRGGSARDNFLTKDANFIEKPWQDLAKISFEATAGRGAVDAIKQWQEYDAIVAQNAETGRQWAQANGGVSMSMDAFVEKARVAGLTYGTLNAAIIENRRIIDEQMNAWKEEAAQADANSSAADRFEVRVANAARSTEDLTAATEGTVDILKELKSAASAAWAEVDKLLRPSQDVTIDDFLRSLPDLAKDVTSALQAQTDKPGVLADLDLSGAQEAIRKQARGVISVLAKEYGVGLDGVKALLDQRGLAAVIDALGTVTEDTTETVDPLIAKYASLGASASQLRDAIARLNDQRQTAIQAQIDQVGAALRDATQAAKDARDAVAEFFSGGYIGSAQQQVDKLIGDIGNIGSKIEDALRQGGVRGEAAVRTAFGDVQAQLAAIVNAGFEQGLNGQQIADLIAPVLQAINEEVGQGQNRISSLDFTEGITQGAGQKLMDALQSGLDPGAIQALINNILGADATVAGLQGQLEALQADLKADVQFSPEQVQGALDAMTAETQLTVQKTVITPEAAQLVFDTIMSVFDDPGNKLEAAVDQGIITQQILDAAQAAEDQVSLVFKSGLSFDSATLDEVARSVSAEFYAAFSQGLEEQRDLRAQQAGFDSYSAMVAALGPSVAAATIGAPNVAVNIDAPIDITAVGADPPKVSATQRIAGQSAGAGSTGDVPRSLQDIYGTQVIPGYRGPQ